MSTPFTPIELSVLKQFFAGTRARTIREETGISVWPLVARARALPNDEFEAIKAQRSHLGNQTWIREASPDDPIYTRGTVYFSPKGR